MEPLLRDEARGFGHVSCHAVHTRVSKCFVCLQTAKNNSLKRGVQKKIKMERSSGFGG